MAAKKTKPVVEEVVTPVEPVVEEEIKNYLIVTADNLNVRKGTSKETDILTVVTKGEKLLLNNTKPTKGFYSITTLSGIKGYVMKEYVIEE